MFAILLLGFTGCRQEEVLSYLEKVHDATKGPKSNLHLTFYALADGTRLDKVSMSNPEKC